MGVGRGAPEIDINEAQISYPRAELNLPGTIGSASQSIQVAPMDTGYQWNNGTSGMQIFDPNITYQSECLLDWYARAGELTLAAAALCRVPRLAAWAKWHEAGLSADEFLARAQLVHRRHLAGCATRASA